MNDVAKEINEIREKLNARIYKDGKAYSAISRQERLALGERMIELMNKLKEQAA